MQNIQNRKFFGFSVGPLALFAVGGYLLWSNRFRIQRLLESRGIKTDLMTGSLTDTVRSGAAKISGSVDHELNRDNRIAG